jgi:hypothetical protein
MHQRSNHVCPFGAGCIAQKDSSYVNGGQDLLDAPGQEEARA